MATIVSTTVTVHNGTTEMGVIVGTITLQGSPATVSLDSARLGASLLPGHQYCAVASCTNSDQYTASTAPYAFKTQAFAEIISLTVRNDELSGNIELTYDSNVMSIADCGIIVSTNAGGTNPTRIPISEQDIGQFVITTLNENTTYYCVPYVTDDINDPSRLYIGDWADAERITIGYKSPVITISNISTTYNSVSGNFNVTTNDTLSSVYMTIEATAGTGVGTVYRINKNATTGTQSFTITDGDTDANGQRISIYPSTQYLINVYAYNTSGNHATAFTNATTAQQAQSTIAITSISSITPTSAVVNLSYGSTQGVQSVTP